LADYSPRTLLGYFKFAANFGLAKGAIYLAPLGVAAVASQAVYGAVELAWSVGLLVASFTIAVPISGINQRFLIRHERHIGDEMAFLLLVFAGLSLVAAFVGYFAGAPPSLILIAAAFGSTAIHTEASTLFRMYARPNLSAWSDGTAMLCTALIILICLLFGIGLSIWSLTIGYVALGLVATLTAGIILLRMRKPGLTNRLWRSTTLGLPMVVGGVMALWLGVGGRLTIGALVTHHIAAYSVAFRVAGLALGLHQLATTLYYARLYASRTRAADALISRFYVAVAVFSLLMSLGGAAVIARLHLKALPVTEMATFQAILPIVSIQIFFWIGFAMLQMRINRSGLAGRAIWPLTAVTLGGALVIFGTAMIVEPDVIWVCWGIALHAGTYFATAYLLLARKRLPHVRMGTIGLCGGGLLIAAALVQHLLA